jgi:hypothetical protein
MAVIPPSVAVLESFSSSGMPEPEFLRFIEVIASVDQQLAESGAATFLGAEEAIGDEEVEAVDCLDSSVIYKYNTTRDLAKAYLRVFVRSTTTPGGFLDAQIEDVEKALRQSAAGSVLFTRQRSPNSNQNTYPILPFGIS